MTKLYKLTDENDRTYGGCQWGEGVEHTAPGEGELCSAGWLHAYTDPLLAVLLNPIHSDFKHPRLWEAEGDVGKTDRGLKVGCTRLKTVRRIPLPQVTVAQRVRFGILCALAISEPPWFVAWAEKWLSAEDRTATSANDVCLQSWHSPSAAWASGAARAVARGSRSVAWDAAMTAEMAAEEAARLGEALDLAAIARRAIEEEK